MKNKPAAWAALKAAYKTAAPNNILVPFIELGKDIRTLAAAALREHADGMSPGLDIPRSWLESLRHKATSYAKNQSMFVNDNKLFNSGAKVLSAREHDVLSDLYHGFSQSEIADKQSLSINTVKMVTKNIYEKLNVHKISDLIRIAAEQGLV
jgi:LuxR family maltose regulon positive regulatory protein